MRSCKSLILCCTVAALVLPMAALGQNALVNGDFETGDLTGWVVAGGLVDAMVTVQSPDNGPTLPGMYNAGMNNQAEAHALLLKQTTAPGSATAGEITWSVDLKLIEAEVGGVLFVNIFAEGEGLGVIGGSGLQGPFWPWNEWGTFSGSFIAPANTSFLTIQIEAVTGANSTSSCVAHVDNVSLEGQGVVGVEDSTWGDLKALYR